MLASNVKDDQSSYKFLEQEPLGVVDVTRGPPKNAPESLLGQVMKSTLMNVPQTARVARSWRPRRPEPIVQVAHLAHRGPRQEAMSVSRQPLPGSGAGSSEGAEVVSNPARFPESAPEGTARIGKTRDIMSNGRVREQRSLPLQPPATTGS